MQHVYRIFAGLFILAISLTVLSLFITSGNFLIKHNPKSMDFLAFYTGADVLKHNSQQLYNFAYQRTIQQSILGHTKTEFLAFDNPPFVAFLFLPFTNLTLINAYDLWLITNTVFLAFFCYLTYQQVKPKKWYWALIVILSIITFVPIPTSLLIGQLSIFLCLVLISSWLFFKKGWEFRSGLVLALLVVKPQLLILPFLAVLVQRRIKMIYGLLLGGVLLFLLSSVLIGWNGIITYLSSLNDAYNGNASYGIDLMSEHTIQTALLIIFRTHTLSVIRIPWIIIISCMIIPMLFFWSKKFQYSSLQTSLQFIFLSLTMILTSPHTHFYDVSLITVVAIIILSELKTLKQKERKIIFLLLIFYYLLEFLGTFFDVQTKMQTRQLWICIDVSYLLIIWIIVAIKLKHLLRNII